MISDGGMAKNTRHRIRTYLVLAVIAVAAVSFVFYLSTLTLYGCFGCGGSASVTAEPLSCVAVNSTCNISLTNDGNGNAWADGCYFAKGSQNVPGSLADSSGKTGYAVEVQAGQSVTVQCTDSVSPASGSSAAGYVQLTNDFSVAFASIWS